MSKVTETSVQIEVTIQQKLDNYQSRNLIHEKLDTTVPGEYASKKTRKETLASLRELKDKVVDRFDQLIEAEEEEAAEEEQEG